MTIISKVFFISAIVVTGLNASFSWAEQPCSLRIPVNQYLVDGEVLGVKPGDTICLESGERGPMRIQHLHGSDSLPITVTNVDGPVTTTPYEYSIALEDASFVILKSSETKQTDPYQIKLGGTLSVGQLSHHVTIEGVEIYRARFAGMLIKTDPTCDPRTWRSNFLMSGLRVRGNYIHDTEEGEGMYIGYTGKSRTLMCDGVETTVYPHQLDDVLIENNRVELIAADGIQLNSVKQEGHIKGNRIYQTGLSPFAPVWQNTGIQVGGDNVTISDNLIVRAGGNGMMLDGDNLSVIGNMVIMAGENAIFSRNPAQQDSQNSGGLAHQYRQNVLIQSGDYAIKNYAILTSTPHMITQNTIEHNGERDAANRLKIFSYLNDTVSRQEENNLIVDSTQ
ncbi:right-handed parallel beta-helix repeat-containing protein [Vibrio ostreicida]|uniref:Right-handed parallel beta-helix repeat-containing protein n=1 Tax=Vibrio ostreicida TaxID=526588 RepID=A0ABT8BYN6_9VIBR|nr:right-handed parallel beta-helix repeat-containing protein [Vibrio ostreicida]MDN3611479.1 right-handed parallel beta-helix repeat-containing protein [Vibrio ostreicida]NPD08978.1 right-handed parallel beta-helix repeat-containing protein [Vibrio ostreicida]